MAEDRGCTQGLAGNGERLFRLRNPSRRPADGEPHGPGTLAGHYFAKDQREDGRLADARSLQERRLRG